MSFRTAYDPARALEAAWAAIRREPLVLLLGGVLVFVFDDDNGAGIAARFSDADEDWAPLILFFALVAAGWGLVMLAFSSWLYAGFARALERTLATGSSSPTELFADRDRWWRIALARLLQAAVFVATLLPAGLVVGLAVLAAEGFDVPADVAGPSTALALVLYVPVVVWVMLGTALVRPAAALEGLGPVAAMRRSWSLVRGNRLWLLLYGLLLWVVTIAGFLLCCVGVLFTATWTTAAWLESYLALVRGDRSGWWIAGEPSRRAPGSAALDGELGG